MVFSNILNNAVGAVDENGRVIVSTRQTLAEIEIEIEDNGRGVESGDLRNIFDPGFKVSGGRMAAGNWSLFSSRQIVREHGGEIRIASSEGQGTRVTITLPLKQVEQN